MLFRSRNPETGTRRKTSLAVADDFADADGKEVLSFSQAQEAARLWFDQARADSTGLTIIRGPFTVAHAMSAYLDHMDQAGKKSAADARKRTLHHILPALGGVEVSKLTRLRLEGWINDLAASPCLRKPRLRPLPKNPRKPKKYLIPEPKFPKTQEEKRARRASANRALSTLKAALTYAKSRALVMCSEDAWRHTKPFGGVDVARRNYLTPEEQQRLLNVIQEVDFKKLVSGALLTGCRYGELVRMAVRDFDPTAGNILIRIAKDGKSRRAILTEEGQRFFLSVTAGRVGTETLFQRGSAERRTRIGLVDPLAWAPSEQTRRMHVACEAAGLPRMGFHQLRHSYASALVSAGMPLAYVAQLIGHANTAMLEKHYAHLAPSDLSRSLEALAPRLNLVVLPVLNLEVKKQGA